MTRFLLPTLILASALGVALLPGASALAGFPVISYVLTIGSLDLETGQQGSVELRMTEIEGQAASWIVDIAFDPAVVSVIECTPPAEGVCDVEQSGTIGVTGVTAKVLVDDTTLATITFECADAGASPLALTWEFFGIPEIILDVETRDGTISCEVSADGTATKQAPATIAAAPGATVSAPPQLPATGSGPTSARQVRDWWPVGLSLVLIAATGLAVAWTWQRRL